MPVNFKISFEFDDCKVDLKGWGSLVAQTSDGMGGVDELSMNFCGQSISYLMKEHIRNEGKLLEFADRVLMAMSILLEVQHLTEV